MSTKTKIKLEFDIDLIEGVSPGHLAAGRILRYVAAQIELGHSSGKICDCPQGTVDKNGTAVIPKEIGSFSFV